MSDQDSLVPAIFRPAPIVREPSIRISCPCGAVFEWSHGDTERGSALARTFIWNHQDHTR